MYECFHCGAIAVSWDADFDFSDYDYEGEGIIHECHCNNCGALITYVIPIKNTTTYASTLFGEESGDTI